MGAREVTAFVTYLAVTLPVSPSTQNKAFNALMFMCRAEEQLGHKDGRTTQIYTHVLNREGNAVQSPLGAVLSSA